MRPPTASPPTAPTPPHYTTTIRSTPLDLSHPRMEISRDWLIMTKKFVQQTESSMMSSAETAETSVCPNARNGASRTSSPPHGRPTHPSLTEVEPDVFYLCTSNVYTDHKSSLHHIDLRSWTIGNPIQPQKVLDFFRSSSRSQWQLPDRSRTILVADSIAGLILESRSPERDAPPVARVWLQHESMGYSPGELKPEQPRHQRHSVRTEAWLHLLHGDS
jgi:hypothetical protein